MVRRRSGRDKGRKAPGVARGISSPTPDSPNRWTGSWRRSGATRRRGARKRPCRRTCRNCESCSVPTVRPSCTAAGGYVLDLNPNALDASRFEAAVAAASAIEGGDQRLALLDEALERWRGAPLDEFAGQAWADERARQWTRMYVLAHQLRTAALLDAGRHRDALPNLEQLVAAHPLHEPYWSQLVVARYRCGQQADALAAVSEARKVLATELGIEPGPELIELENKVLTQDPSLDAPRNSADAMPARSAGTVVEPLPGGVVTFLLTDIEGSAALWDLHAEEMAERWCAMKTSSPKSSARMPVGC